MKAMILILGLLIGVNAHANYFKGAAGLTIGGEAETSGAISSSADLDTSFLFPLVAAYGFELSDSLFGEAEFSLRQNDYDVGPNDASVTAFAFNVVGNVPMNGFSLTGGIGATFGMYDLGILDDGNAFGMQVFGGADFNIKDNITIGGEIRYFTTITDVDMGNDVDGEYNQTALLFTAKFAL